MRERQVLVAAVIGCLLLPLAGALASGNGNRPVDFAAVSATSEDQGNGRPRSDPESRPRPS